MHAECWSVTRVHVFFVAWHVLCEFSYLASLVFYLILLLPVKGHVLLCVSPISGVFCCWRHAACRCAIAGRGKRRHWLLQLVAVARPRTMSLWKLYRARLPRHYLTRLGASRSAATTVHP